MAKIEPTPSRARITETGRVLHIVIPAQRNWLSIVFLSLWLVGWTIGEISVLLKMLNGSGNDFFLLFAWFMGWTFGGAWAWTKLLWNLFGREIVVVEGAAFWIRWAVGKRGVTREFDLAHMENLRVDLSPSRTDYKYRKAHNGLPSAYFIGPVVFDYGAKSYRFGQGVNEPEARQIVAAIARRLAPPDVSDAPETPEL
jgi:hypothetical protein